MAQTSDRSTVDHDDEELTPELALVDPELASRARARLESVAEAKGAAADRTPEPEPEPEHLPEPAPEPVMEVVPDAEEAEQEPEAAAAADPDWEYGDVPARPRRRRAARVLLFAVTLAAAVALGLLATRLLLEGSTASPQTGALEQATAPTVGIGGPVRGTTAETGETRENAAPAAPAPGQPRSFGWVPVARASHYRVEFFRGRNKIYEALPRRPPLVVPGSWTYRGRRHSLSPGEYRWVVRPGFGPRRRARYGPAVVDARLTVRR